MKGGNTRPPLVCKKRDGLEIITLLGKGACQENLEKAKPKLEATQEEGKASRRLAELEKRLESHDEQIQLILRVIKQLMAAPERPPKKIGFQLKERRAVYGRS